MQLCCAFLALSSALQVLASGSVGLNDAWIRKYPCGPDDPEFPSLDTTPFWIDSFRGVWTNHDRTSELRMGVLAVHNKTLFDCEDVDVQRLEDSLDFELLGRSVGRLEDFWVECPLPITDTLTPIGSDLFSTFQLVYKFPSAHRLQTVVSALRFNRPNGTELDCAVVKITPDHGNSVSAAFTYTPLGVLSLIALSSWRTHLDGLEFTSVFSHDSAFAGQGPLWATVLDMSNYLRYLQFIFLSASMTVEYPGFYVPAVGNFAWSSLLYWRGLVDDGFLHQGIDGGMYVSNASYGMQFMPQMLGYPNALNTSINSLINLAILVVTIFVVLVLLLLKVRQPSQVEKSYLRSTLTKAATVSGGIVLCFFSVPLLSYLAYDTFLIGYLPIYRTSLAIAMVLVVIGAQHFLTVKIDRQIQLEVHSKGGNSTGYLLRGWKLTQPHIPHLMPLLQAIGVGSLQGWPVAQICVLAVCELVLLLHTVLARSSASSTTATICSVVKLVTVLMSITFISSPKEVTRQAVGYAMLALHGGVVAILFPAHSAWKLYRSFQDKEEPFMDGLPSRSDPLPDYSLTASRHDLLARHRTGLGRDYIGHVREPPWQYPQQDTSSFYRTPRSRAPTPGEPTTPTTPGGQQSSSLGSIIELAPIRSADETPFDLKLALSEVPEVDVDYSVREVDRYYGVASEASTSTDAPASDISPVTEQDHASGVSLAGKCKQALSSNLGRFTKKRPNEKGFQVVRPRMPPPNDGGGEGSVQPPQLGDKNSPGP